MSESPFTWHAGGCHCGGVRFEVALPVIEAISEALLLDGGGLGGGGAAEGMSQDPFGGGALQRSSSRGLAPTTIPDPSSIEEEGGSASVGLVQR